MEETIRAGRAKYAAGQYKEALHVFTEVRHQHVSRNSCKAATNCVQAISLCPCALEKRKRKREAQELPDTEGANQAVLDVTVECYNPLHLQALSYRAGTFEKIPDIRRAKADAQRMVRIAPNSPEVRISYLEQIFSFLFCLLISYRAIFAQIKSYGLIKTPKPLLNC